MKTIKERHAAISTLLAFALIPLSGFATDVYIPSFPAMTEFFGISRGDIQLSLVAFVVSSGIAQLFVGSLLDTFGRYNLSLSALLIFAISSFVIALSGSLPMLLTMRVIQGMSVAMIVVSKRAYFIDLYAGDQLKHYTSLFSIIWATAPIIAPFLGGLLQHYFGWQSNFYFLGGVTLVLLVLELVYSGETLETFKPFGIRPLLTTYSSVLNKPDYTLSLVILGLSFSMIMLFNMTSPFIIEKVFHQSAVVTGNSALLSGVAVLAGGLLSKFFINRTINDKVWVAGPLLFSLAALATGVMAFMPNLIVMMTMVVLLNIVSGFLFNTFYTYALGRFSSNAGIVSGITGGGTYIMTSVFSYTIVNALHIQNVVWFALGYWLIASLIGIALILFVQSYKRRLLEQIQANPAIL